MANANHNLSQWATIDDQAEIFAQGTFKNVWEGVYSDGPQKGQGCVCKQFKTGFVFESHYFAEEMTIIRRTQKIVDHFMNAEILGPDGSGRRLFLNTPEVWTCQVGGRKALVEPMLGNFKKFNSNTGWASSTDDAWNEAMQALSHFSYHDSNRQFLLCDLQGGMCPDGYILTDPAIMSRAQDCGPTDLGPAGVSAFFQRHKCGRFCAKHWAVPDETPLSEIPKREGTSMAVSAHWALPMRPARKAANTLPKLRE
ncbi:Alpha-protein kinase vwkA [Lachnellula suecica]|uniref:Alpha-protein kinase vwkA n=1 Tax=Lachnellula suecica TaxID=602035 RepID=A0A8T9CBV8_9HELO|nr:Alpha-protein kinase vwkA [Lachnellula suecica]